MPTSEYFGVSWFTQNQKWQCQLYLDQATADTLGITNKKRKLNLGLHEVEEEGAHVVDVARKLWHKELGIPPPEDYNLPHLMEDPALIAELENKTLEQYVQELRARGKALRSAGISASNRRRAANGSNPSTPRAPRTTTPRPRSRNAASTSQPTSTSNDQGASAGYTTDATDATATTDDDDFSSDEEDENFFGAAALEIPEHLAPGKYTKDKVLDALLWAEEQGISLPGFKPTDIQKLKDGTLNLCQLLGSENVDPEESDWESDADTELSDAKDRFIDDEQFEEAMARLKDPQLGIPVEKMHIRELWTPGVFERLVKEGKIDPKDYEGQDPANSFKNFKEDLLKAAGFDPDNLPDTSDLPFDVHEVELVMAVSMRAMRKEKRRALRQAEREAKERFETADGAPNMEACKEAYEQELPFAHNRMAGMTPEQQAEYVSNLSKLAKLTGATSINFFPQNTTQQQAAVDEKLREEKLKRDLAAYDAALANAATTGVELTISEKVKFWTPEVLKHMQECAIKHEQNKDLEREKFADTEYWNKKLTEDYLALEARMKVLQAEAAIASQNTKCLMWNSRVAAAVQLKDHPTYGPDMVDWFKEIVGEDWEEAIAQHPDGEVFGEDREPPPFNNPFTLMGIFDEDSDLEDDEPRVDIHTKVEMAYSIFWDHPQGYEYLRRLHYIYMPTDLLNEVNREAVFEARKEKYGLVNIAPGVHLATKRIWSEWHSDEIEFEIDNIQLHGVVRCSLPNYSYPPAAGQFYETDLFYYQRMLDVAKQLEDAGEEFDKEAEYAERLEISEEVSKSQVGVGLWLAGRGPHPTAAADDGGDDDGTTGVKGEEVVAVEDGEVLGGGDGAREREEVDGMVEDCEVYEDEDDEDDGVQEVTQGLAAVSLEAAPSTSGVGGDGIEGTTATATATLDATAAVPASPQQYQYVEIAPFEASLKAEIEMWRDIQKRAATTPGGFEPLYNWFLQGRIACIKMSQLTPDIENQFIEGLKIYYDMDDEAGRVGWDAVIDKHIRQIWTTIITARKTYGSAEKMMQASVEHCNEMAAQGKALPESKELLWSTSQPVNGGSGGGQ